MITDYSRRICSTNPFVEFCHNSRGNPTRIRCIKDGPFMKGFGRDLKIGDEVVIDGLVCDGSMFQVAVPSECAFYDVSHFEPV